jgi:hypothetical protein
LAAKKSIVMLVMLIGAARPALAGPPFLTDDPEPVDYGHWEVYGFSTGAWRAAAATGFGPSLEVNYGAIPDVQLHVIMNGAYDAPAGQAGRVGLGDTELGVKYRLLNPGEGDWWPEAGIFPAIQVPSGNARRGLGAGYYQAYLPIWLQQGFGKWTIDGGGGFWINPGPGNRDYWFGGFLLQRQVTEKLMLGVEVFHQTASMVGRGESSGFNVGGVYDFTPHYHLLTSVGRGGLANAVDAGAVRAPFTYYAALQWTF